MHVAILPLVVITLSAFHFVLRHIARLSVMFDQPFSRGKRCATLEISTGGDKFSPRTRDARNAASMVYQLAVVRR